MPGHSVGIGLASRRLTTHPVAPMAHGHRISGTLGTCTDVIDSTSGKTIELVSWGPPFPGTEKKRGRAGFSDCC